MRTKYPGIVEKIRDLTPTIRELTIRVESADAWTFTAGQFVMLQVPQEDAKVVQRAYSIASSDKLKNHFSLVFKRVPGGVASEYVWAMSAPTKIEITGPFGKCRFLEPPTARAIFLCTGAGVSQHMSFLLSHGEKYPKTEFRMLMGVWNKSEIFYEDELTRLKSQLGNFDFEFVLDKPEAGWNGKIGYVTDFLSQFDLESKPTSFYLCGRPEMIQGAKEILVARPGFNHQLVVEESFNH